MKIFKNTKSIATGLVGLGLLATLSSQSVYAQSSQLWSDVFGNAGANATVHIRQGQRILIDRNIDVGGIIVEGELLAQDTRNLTVSTDWALVINGGLFQVGTSNDPFENDFTLTLTGDNPNRDLDLRNQIGMRINNNDAFLMGMGNNSRIRFYGADAQKRSWTQVTSTVQAGSSVLLVADRTGWEAGDRIAIASTSSDFDEAEALTIQSISNNGGGQRIVVEETIQNRHYGEIERYNTGTRNWDIDMRAEVGLLSRNVTVTGDENADQDEFGGHIMVANNASLNISGTELTRMGQFGVLGRYPAHWHLLGDTSGQYIRNSSVHNTFNKGVTIHGTNDIGIDSNVIFDHIGHGVFLEDGNEIRTEITDNLVFVTRRAPNGASVPSDISSPTSYWIEHPNNTLTGNTAGGSAEAGFWIFGNTAPHGDSQGRPVPPGNFSNFVFDNNTAHSSEQGFFVDGFVRPNGSVQIGQLVPRNSVSALMSNLTAYQIRNPNQGAVWIRAENFSIKNVMVADSTEGVFFWGRSYVQDGIVVAESRGNSEPWQDGRRQKGVRIYNPHSSAVSDVHFVGFNERNNHANGIIVGSDGALFVRSSRTHDTPTHIRGLTFDGTTDIENILGWDTPAGTNINQVSDRLVSRIVDHDGSLSGRPSTRLAPNRRAEGTTLLPDIGFALGGSWISNINNLLTWNQALAQTFSAAQPGTDLRNSGTNPP